MTEPHEGEIVGISEQAKEQRLFVERAATGHDPVTLVGDPGTGKQLMAKLIHSRSPRCDAPFLMIDCSLYYERELSRELFGYHSGNAKCKPRKGLFDFAGNGTCYLSRIEELTPTLQECLLRFLCTGRYSRLGDGKEISSGVRLVVSSDKNLQGFVEAGLFDATLYERLSPLMVRLVSLRERKEDIAALVEFVTNRFAAVDPRGERMVFSQEAMQALEAYPWPNNFDEILKEIQRLLECGFKFVRCENLAMEISSYWLGQHGDPLLRKVLEELDGYIKEFKVLSHIEAGLGELVPSVEGLYGQSERDLPEDY